MVTNNQLSKKKIEISYKKLDMWINKNGWAGYDPYDIKENRLIQKLISKGNNSRIWEIIREFVLELVRSFPQLFNHIFKIKKKINPKGIALLSISYLNLYKSTNNKSFFEKSESCLRWLEENVSTLYNGWGWGYPFDWQSQKLIPKNTPNGIVTTVAGEAFWDWYIHTNDKKYLDICIKIGEFLINLPKDEVSNSQICFSYTPLYINHVHNLNLFVAEFLLKVGKKTHNKKWEEIALKAINYTISNQLQSGAFDYNGPPERSRNFTDNYHTGFVLRMLHSVWKLTGDKKVYTSMENCYKHYIENFFLDKTIPKLLPDRTYRIDIHSCAESIHCLMQLSDTYPEGIQIANNIANWTIDNLQSSEGYFYYGILKSRFTGKIFKSKIPYMRWGQAWMMKALSTMILNLKEQSQVNI